MPKKSEVKKANIALHDKTAHFFEERNVELFNVVERRNFDERIREADQTCKRHVICCDLGCGPGFLIQKQLPRFEEAVGLDISKEMIRVCKAKGLGKSACFIVADAENLPFRNNVFDIVTMRAALHHIPSVSRCFKEIYRALTKEGIMYIDHEPNSKQVASFIKKFKILPKFLDDLHVRRYGTGQSSYSLFPPEYRIADVHESEGFSSREVRKKLTSIGFSVAKTKGHHTSFMYLYTLPSPLNSLSLVDRLLDSLPLVKHISSHICIWARK
jgi:ubiquinone/menaquinone biosynthesis C-methylase UbiE